MIQTKKRGFRERTQPFEGMVEIWVHKAGQLVDVQRMKNTVLFQGNAEVIRAICSTLPLAPRVITRMAIGDQGAIPSDPTTPKVPVKSATGLYHELYRKDVDSSIQTIYSLTPLVIMGNTTPASNILSALTTTAGIVNGMVVTGTGIPQGTVVTNVLSASTVQISNAAISSNTGININFLGAVNECQFIATFDSATIPVSTYANPTQPRVNEVGLVIVDPNAHGTGRAAVLAPTAPYSDEVVMTVRTFKSVPFEIANDTTITIRYTIFTE